MKQSIIKSFGINDAAAINEAYWRLKEEIEVLSKPFGLSECPRVLRAFMEARALRKRFAKRKYNNLARKKARYTMQDPSDCDYVRSDEVRELLYGLGLVRAWGSR